MPPVPAPRGPLSAAVLAALRRAPGTPLPEPAAFTGDPLADDDLQLALYCCYELHYRGLAGVDERWEWDAVPARAARAAGGVFEDGVATRPAAAPPAPDAEEMDLALRGDRRRRRRARRSRATSSARARCEQMREFVIHRSAYQLKEADPHSWAIPRLSRRAEGGAGRDPGRRVRRRAARAHARRSCSPTRWTRSASTPRYGAYLDALPGVTLATVNLMSLLRPAPPPPRRDRRATSPLFEMTSSIPNRRYADGAAAARRRRARATAFFDEHVEADAVHENIAAVDLAGGLAAQEPALAGDVLFGARALLAVEARWAAPPARRVGRRQLVAARAGCAAAAAA